MSPTTKKVLSIVVLIVFGILVGAGLVVKDFSTQIDRIQTRQAKIVKNQNGVRKDLVGFRDRVRDDLLEFRQDHVDLLCYKIQKDGGTHRLCLKDYLEENSKP